jgi:uncharacterized protein
MTTKTKELRYVPAELRAVKNEDGSRSVSGYAAVFNSPSLDFGGWTEVIAPGAFTKSLLTNPDVMLLRDHDSAILLGRTTSKTLTLSEDPTGLRFACELPNTTQANDLAVLIDRGDISGCSFGFICNIDNWADDGKGNTVRTVLDADLFDVSIVAQPAYPDTSLSLRSAPAEVRSMIEQSINPPKPVDAEKRDLTDSLCGCNCAQCASDCDGCLDTECDEEFCSCAASTEKFRNRAHMILELARHRAQ